MVFPASIPSPDLSYFQIGPFTVHFYALCILAGIIVAWAIAAKRIEQRGGDRGAALDFTVWAVVMGIIGARVYHVLTHWGDYFGPGKNFFDVFAIWQGGIAIFGALIGGAVGVLIASRITGIRFWSFADALVPGLLIAQALGRLGNWFNSELFGGPTTLPWGLEIASSNPAFPIGLPMGTLFHPTFLYEMVLNLLGVVVLLAIERRFSPRWGTFFGMYLIWYGLVRFFVEGLRVDPSMVILGLRSNELTALLAVLLGIVLILVQKKRHPGVEASIYLPGRSNPMNDIDKRTANPEEFFHVLEKR